MKLKQEDLLIALKNKSAYPHTTSHIETIETHISWVLLTGRIAYKLKKAVRFGNVLDFSNLNLRKKFCQREVNINKMLCGSMYQSVVKVIKTDSVYKLVNLDEKGTALEYAVKMIQIHQNFRLDNLLVSSKVTNHMFNLLIDNLVRFHNQAYTSRTISKYGRPQIMKSKINENFKTISKFSKFAKIDPVFHEKLNQFVENNFSLFDHRRKRYRIRDIHGDLYLKNIFYVKGKYYMYDRIEFNDSLRYADIAEDVAHLAMDIHYHNRDDLKSYLISSYINKSNDTSLNDIIYFMMCYKACVRAKVSLFRADQSTDRSQKLDYIHDAKEHFELARKYLKMF